MVKNIGILLILSSLLHGCYFYEFFAKKPDDDASFTDDVQDVLGISLGPKAGSLKLDQDALNQVYNVTTSIPPAAIRPDPDLFPRLMLRQFRTEGTTLARSIGRIEKLKQLHGGATTDFATAPSETYDATSVLAQFKIAEQLCQALVSPLPWQEIGWSTILPNPAGQVRENLRYLAQRFTGLPLSQISDTQLIALEQIYQSNSQTINIQTGFENYIAPCTALAVDAHSMLF